MFNEIAEAAFQDEMSKIAGVVSEGLGTAFTPFGLIGAPIGAVAAAITPTRTAAE